MKIVVAQYWTDNVSYAPYTEKINKTYCEEHDYVYHVEKDTNKIIKDLNFKDRAFQWYKVLLVKEVLEKYNPDYVFFLDADAIFVDYDNEIENFIYDDKEIVCTQDYGPSRMNSGVMIFKNTQWVKDFLTKWYEYGEKTKGGHKQIEGFYKRGLWHEQTCFGQLYDNNEDVREKTKIIDNKILNNCSFSDDKVKNFIFHAFKYGSTPNRTIDTAYYKMFNIEPPKNASLNELGRRFGTDKLINHNYYERFYEKLLTPLKEKCDILEITPDNSSLEVWKNFFEKGKIHNLNTKNRNITVDERVSSRKINQSQIDEIKNYVQLGEKYDVIIDDGTHKMYDQQVTIQHFFDCLKPNGIYVIEDLQTSLECRMPSKAIWGWGDPDKMTTLEMLQSISNGEPKTDYKTDKWNDFLNQIDEIKISNDKNDSIYAIITKKGDKSNNQIQTDKKIETKEKINAIVYHVYCVDNYLEIVNKQMNRLYESGLYDYVDIIEVMCVNPDGDFDEIDKIFKKFNKIKVNKILENKFEYWGLKKVWDLSQQYDGNIFYFHAKGVSNKYIRKGNNEVSDLKVSGVNHWRDVLEHFCIDEWKNCIEALKNNDNCGVTSQNRWWSGNFWWSTLEWIRNNPQPKMTSNRWYFESWLNKDRNPRIKEFSHYDFNRYFSKVPLDYYKTKDWARGKDVKILSAEYGVLGVQIDEGHKYSEKKTIDVTDVILENLSKNDGKKINIRAGNNLKGDPVERHKKHLIINFSVDGEDYRFVYNEGNNVMINLEGTKEKKETKKMKKVALINTLFFNDRPKTLKVIDDYFEMSEIFFKSAKKYFLTNHDVDFIAITNNDRDVELSYVETIKTDYKTPEYDHILGMKIFCLEFLKEKYDYIFVADTDQIIINEITDEDIMDTEYVFMRHYWQPKVCNKLQFKTTHINIDCSDKHETTMGNFYGGTSEHVYKLYDMSKKIHDELYGKVRMGNLDFYTRTPDEVFIIKYAYENDVNYKVLSCNFDFANGKESFLTDFKPDVKFYPDIKNAKMIHDTKKDMNVLREISKYYSID